LHLRYQSLKNHQYKLMEKDSKQSSFLT